MWNSEVVYCYWSLCLFSVDRWDTVTEIMKYQWKYKRDDTEKIFLIFFHPGSVTGAKSTHKKYIYQPKKALCSHPHFKKRLQNAENKVALKKVTGNPDLRRLPETLVTSQRAKIASQSKTNKDNRFIYPCLANLQTVRNTGKVKWAQYRLHSKWSEIIPPKEPPLPHIPCASSGSLQFQTGFYPFNL